MALPQLTTPEYTITLPSTGDEIKYRPFLVKEEKVLLIALETEIESNINDAIVKIVHECTDGAAGYQDTPLFDLEYLFINIRGKSVGDVLDLKVTCPDDEETEVDVKVNIEDIKVTIEKDHSNEIKLTDDVTLVMSYPTTQTTKHISDLKEGDSSTEAMFKLIQACVFEIRDKDTVYSRADMSEKELTAFFDQMTNTQLEEVNKFFDTMPKVRHVMKVRNPNTKKTSEVVLEDLADFFV